MGAINVACSHIYVGDFNNMSKFSGHDWTWLYYQNDQCQCQHCREERLDLRSNVSCGAGLLDSVAPGWEHRVRLNILDMSGGPGHLAMQILGSTEVGNMYEALRILLGLKISEAPKYGLGPSSRHIGKALNGAWEALILRRLVEAV